MLVSQITRVSLLGHQETILATPGERLSSAISSPPTVGARLARDHNASRIARKAGSHRNGWNGSSAEIIAQTRRTAQFGQKQRSEKTTARQNSRESRHRICQRSPSNAIPGVYKNRETCLLDQESIRGTIGCVQALPMPYSSCPAILGRYHDFRNQGAAQRLLSLRFHARRSKIQLLSHRRCRRDPAVRQSGYSLPKSLM